MNIALGLTDAACAPAGAILASRDDLALVTVPGADARTARERLSLQVKMARDLPAFLPFKPREPVDVAVALSRVSTASSTFRAQLNACRGSIQMTVAVVAPRASEDDAVQSWLRRRAAAAGRRSAATASLVDRLGTVGASRLWADAKLGFVHLLGDKAIGNRIRAALGSELGCGNAPALQGCAVTVTGPWPVYARLEEGALS